MNGRLASLMRKEFIQFFRDKVLVILVLYSFVETALCGWALSLETKHLSTAIYDLDKSAQSRAFMEEFRGSGYFDLDYYVENWEQLDGLLEGGAVTMGIVIPADFSRNLGRGRTAQVQLLADGTDSTTASLALGYAAQIARRYSQRIELERMNMTSEQLSLLPRVVNQIRIWYLPGLEYSKFTMVSMVAAAVVMLGAILPAWAIVREKEAGTLEQLMVTPIRPYELIAAKVVPMIILKIVGLAIGVVISILFFGVPVRGNIILFFALSILVFLSSSGLGVWIANQSKNLQQALLLAFFILFPLMFLSGSIVPIESMPRILQYLTYLSPLRYYMTISMGIFLKGVGMEVLWPHALALAALGAAILGFSIARFRSSLV